MPNSSLFNKFLSLSPNIEIFVRHLYWKNIYIFNKFLNASNVDKKPPLNHTRLNTVTNILDFLSDCGVTRGSLLILHSAFSPLRATGKSPEQIIRNLIDFLGPHGTLAMPAMPKFLNSVEPSEYITKDISKLVFDYDVNNSGITTGVLPRALCAWPGAVRSRHPINTMVAHGPHAVPMMVNNLSGRNPLPCGIDSSWCYCYAHDAFVVSLGVDLAHSLTMIHVAEDLLDDKWPIKNWYREKHFVIRDNDGSKEATLRERHPKWGTLHYAERTLCKDLINQKIMRTTEIDGVVIECLKAKELIKYLNTRNHTGYPYYGINKHEKNSAS